ncbi:hypothetical protein [Runella sp.]|uniref:hypothetical protein n=1 Tax=Runella sp. TaxID=1960881 RepID=UPI003D0D6FE7
MKNTPNFQKLHKADLMINSSVEPTNNNDDKAFSDFLKNKKSKVKALPPKKVLR